jgi:hypothetical protein
MHPTLVGLLLLPLSASALAEIVVLNDITAQNGVQLSAEELKRLMPNAAIVSFTPAGSSRRWTNDSNGTLVASSDNRGRAGGPGRPTQGRGTWHVADNGTYCITVEWPTTSENWCRFIFKVGSEYYGVKSAKGGTEPAHRLEISK